MADATARRPKVLLVYYSFTGQSVKVLEAAGEVFAQRGCEVDKAAIELIDPRYAERFSRFPLRHVWRDMLSVLPAQTRRRTAQIRTPDEIRAGDYDLICIGSPTWWDAASLPVRSFLMSSEARTLLDGKPFAVFVVCRRLWRANTDEVTELGRHAGGRFVGAIHFDYPGSQLRSLLSMTSYLASGEYRDRYLGLRIPQTNIAPEHLDEARRFASTLADDVFGPPPRDTALHTRAAEQPHQ
ncbi:flavodoxin family protein [Mycolicibacterium baixiangningiae]|uniref:flavodoxin family protein n=1 Tax=Mycolicibacterium baixiangningiae TaxID=2761578 RepID=UPI0018D1869D|nr:flavodoxin family protein [Mycolicibacterium baixiangningiae]